MKSSDDEAGQSVEQPAKKRWLQGRVTQHSLSLASGDLAYKATADWIRLRKIQRPIGDMFYTAYVAEGENRPLTFVFNGGPGAASAFLHMGALGPQRVAFGDQGAIPAPPVQVVDNLETWLAFTDLVFIDPMGTGFSRAIELPKKDDDKSEPPKEKQDFWEIEKDVDSLGEFINRYLSEQHRWLSPIFIAGESYGGFRVAMMARKLQESHGVPLCGALLISPAIEFDSLFGSDYNLTHWIELFPSLAASARQQGKTTDELAKLSDEEFRATAEAFAQTELALLLIQGDRLPREDRDQVIARMSELCGLPAPLLERAGGRITSSVFARELLRDQQRLCGRYDGSITTVDPFPDRNDYEGPDPTLFSIDRLFTAAVNHQLRRTLRVNCGLHYRLLSMEVNRAWKVEKSKDHAFRRLAGALDDLRYGMSLNEHMKVFICHGYFDLITPYGSTQRLIDLMKLTPSQQENLTSRNYHGGHMFYSWDDSRQAFLEEAQAFYNSAIQR